VPQAAWGVRSRLGQVGERPTFSMLAWEDGELLPLARHRNRSADARTEDGVRSTGHAPGAAKFPSR
ncbi:MAG TPA: hypothetical protein VNM72_10345, partial [Blastocatellia bacterium]|nr:hypothetical protein [Blastocatellia bacterium]